MSVHGRQATLRRELNYLYAMCIRERALQDEKSAKRFSGRLFKRLLEVIRCTHLQGLELDTQCFRYKSCLFERDHWTWSVRLPNDKNTG